MLVPLNLLVVDDEVSNLEIARVLLEHIGHSVTCCADGLEAARMIFDIQQHIDAVFMDIQMPGMDGLTLTRTLRDHAETAAIPIVCVSARASSADAKQGLEAGCDCYVTKPYKRTELLDALENALSKRRNKASE